MANNEPEIFRQIADYIEKTYIDTLTNKQKIGRYIAALTKGERRKQRELINQRVAQNKAEINSLLNLIANFITPRNNLSLDSAEIKRLLDSIPNLATTAHDSIHTALDEATIPIHRKPIINPKKYKDLDPIQENLLFLPTPHQHQEELDRILRQFEQSQTTDSSTEDKTPAPQKNKTLDYTTIITVHKKHQLSIN